MSALQRLVIAGGGTGGHVYPGVAVAEEVIRRNPDATITFIGTERGLESRILPNLGYTLETITVSRLKGGGIWGRLKGLMRLPVGMFQSWRVLRRYRPQVVLGVGGYASGPALISAWLTWRPTAIQEQNATPGLTNRWLGKVTKAVFLGFDAAKSHFNTEKSAFTGNPIRAALCRRLEAAGGDVASAPTADALTILIFGGSQGARFLNEQVPTVLAQLAEQRPSLRLTITHQTGEAEREQTERRYRDLGLHDGVTVTAFIDDMPSAYGAADLAMCRAGALTVAELTAVGLPSLLVPFPFAADDHQTANAQVIDAAGAGKLVQQRDWDHDAVCAWLTELADDRARLADMAQAAAGLEKLDAAKRIVDRLEELAR